MPTSLTNIQDNQHSQHIHSHMYQPQAPPNNNCESSPNAAEHNRRTIDRNQRNLGHFVPIGSAGDIGIPQTDLSMNNRIPSLRRTPRRTTTGTGNGLPVPNSPRFMRSGISNDLLHHNRSPIPSRVAAAVAAGKRHRLGSRNNENISCGSLNSIEV